MYSTSIMTSSMNVLLYVLIYVSEGRRAEAFDFDEAAESAATDRRRQTPTSSPTWRQVNRKCGEERSSRGSCGRGH